MTSVEFTDTESLIQSDGAQRHSGRSARAIAFGASLLGIAGLAASRWGAAPVARLSGDFATGLIGANEEEGNPFTMGIYLGPETPATECWSVGDGNVLEAADCDPNDPKQQFVWKGKSILFVQAHKDILCMDGDDKGIAFKTCEENLWRQMWKRTQHDDKGVIGNCNCDASNGCPKTCAAEPKIMRVANSSTFKLGGKSDGIEFVWKFKSPDGDRDGGDFECSASGENCSVTKCCKESHMSCFRKDDQWSSCNATCFPNSKWSFQNNRWEAQGEDEKVWDCTKTECTPNGENCMHSKCCAEPGMTCFKKNDQWASCNETCHENMLWIHAEHRWQGQPNKVWDCSVLGRSCTPNGEDCSESKCCSEPGMTCFKKNDKWASCNATCNENMLWIHAEHRWQGQPNKVWDCSVLS